MILLDTNVVSEPLRKDPEARVIEWIDAQPIETLYLSAITIAEMRAGMALLPAGKRRRALEEHLEHQILPLLADRILPFDMSCTHAYAELIGRCRASGRAIGAADGFIAAIAASNGLAVATRDTSPFEAAGLTVINPWEEAG